MRAHLVCFQVVGFRPHSAVWHLAPCVQGLTTVFGLARHWLPGSHDGVQAVLLAVDAGGGLTLTCSFRINVGHRGQGSVLVLREQGCVRYL